MTEQDCSAVLREAVRKLRAKERTMPEAGRPKYGPGLLVAALALEEWAEENEEPKGCTCTPSVIRKHSLGSHGSQASCERTCPVVDVRHSASCALSGIPGLLVDQETHPGNDGTAHRGYTLDCPKCMPLRDMVSPPRALDAADLQVSGRASVRDPEPSVSRFLGASKLPEQEVAYVVQDMVVMRDAQPMSHAVADLILRQSMALLDEGIGPKSYGSILGPDTGPQDVVLILQAVDVIGQENILDRDLQEEIQSMRGEHG